MFRAEKTPCLNIRILSEMKNQLLYKQFYLSHRFLFAQMNGILVQIDMDLEQCDVQF
jgi:hypothetical protein